MKRNSSSNSLEPIRKDPRLNLSSTNSYAMNAYADENPLGYINIDRYKEILSKNVHQGGRNKYSSKHVGQLYNSDYTEAKNLFQNHELYIEDQESRKSTAKSYRTIERPKIKEQVISYRSLQKVRHRK